MATGSTHGGKGSKPRPITDQKKFADNWDAIFGKKNKEPTEEKLKTDQNE